MSEPIFLDGQSRKAFIAEVPNLHGAISFQYRPLLWEEVERVQNTISTFGISSDEHAKRTAFVIGMIVKHVTEWSAEGVKIDAANVRKLHPKLLNRMYYIILGHAASDMPPQDKATPEEMDEFTREILASGGGSTTVTHEAEQTKN